MSQNEMVCVAPVCAPPPNPSLSRRVTQFGTQTEGIRIAGYWLTVLIRDSSSRMCGLPDERCTTGRTGVIEHLTASLKDQTTAVDSRASTLRHEWVARMVRFGATPILIAALLNVFEFHQSTGWRWSWELGCAWFNCLLAVSTLSLTFTRWFTRNWRPAAFFIVSALLASNTVLGTLGQQPKLSSFR